MREHEAELLRAQLIEARAETEIDPIEIAALSGLLARLDPDDPTLHQRAEVADAALQDAAEDALDTLMAGDEDDDPAETWDALCALDELSAAATFLRRPGLILPFVEAAARSVRAFPEPWSAHADAATELLRDRTPLPPDPARILWAAVEASRWRDGVVPAGLGAPDAAKRRLNLSVIRSLRQVFATEELRLNAADEHALPEEPPWSTLGKGEVWELALTVDSAGAPVLWLFGAEGRFERDGIEQAPTRDDGGLRCPAEPGEWTVRVHDEVLRFRIDP